MWCVLAPYTLLHAQDPRFRVERIAATNGQSLGAVFSLMQDSYGYIWIGNVSGMARYDGYSLHEYRYDAFNPSGLSGYKVTCMTEDSAKYIWAGTLSNGLNRLDRRTNTFTHFTHKARDPRTISHDMIRDLRTDRRGDVWIATARGIDRFDTRAQRIIRYPALRVNGHRMITPTALSIDPGGRVWVTSKSADTIAGRIVPSASISVYDQRTDSFRTWPITSAESREIRVIGHRADGSIDLAYLTHNNRNSADAEFIIRFDPRAGSTRALSVVTNVSGVDRAKYALTIDANGSCWYATIAGPKSAQGYSPFYTVHCEAISAHGSAPEQPMVDRYVVTGLPRVALQDRTGTMWIGMEDGLTRISSVGSGITTWRHDPFDTTSLSAQRIRSVLLDRERILWVSTDMGLNRYHAQTNSWKRFYAGDTSRGMLPNSTVNVIYEEPNGTLLMGTNGGLSAYDRRTQRFREASPGLRQPDGAHPIVWSLLRDRTGQLWVGTRYHGLARRSANGTHTTWYRDHAGDSTSILPGGVWSLIEDRHGTVWAGTDAGLCRWIPEQQRFKQYVHNHRDPHSIGGPRIWSLMEDQGGTLWAGSFGGGISRYDRRTDAFESFTTRNGMPSNNVVGMIEDRNGVFWVATSQGLIRWDRQRAVYRLYDRGDGFQDDEFTFKSYFKAPSGQLYFGGTNGLSVFDPSALTTNPFRPPVVITGFRIFDSLTTTELHDHDTVHLTHAQNFFSFEFSALNYINPARNQYAYKLDGVDPSWVRTSSDHRIASYTDLQPGTYTFRVRGSNNDGVWNDHGTMITVVIDTPWWSTWLFRGVVIIILGAVVVSGLRYRTRMVRRLEQEKMASTMQATLDSQELERQRIARDLHDGIGQLLAAANINLARLRDGLQRRAHFGDVAADLKEPLDRTEAILHRTAEDARVLSHALGTSTLQQSGLVAALSELLSSIGNQGRTRFDFIALGLEQRFPEPIETGLFRIAQELITNVMRHANASSASVQIMQEQNVIRLTVEDNGAGFDMSTATMGMGLRNITARVAALGGEVHYDSRVGAGTTVTIAVRTT